MQFFDMCFNYNIVVCHLLSDNFDFRYGANGRMHIYVRICGAQTNTTTSYRRAACWGLPRQTDETPARPINHANNKRLPKNSFAFDPHGACDFPSHSTPCRTPAFNLPRPIYQLHCTGMSWLVHWTGNIPKKGYAPKMFSSYAEKTLFYK